MLPRRESKPLLLHLSGHRMLLAFPLRVEMIEQIRNLGPVSIAQLARQMDRSPNSLYYHVRALAKAGVLVVRGSRRGVRRSEAVYDLAATRIAMACSTASPADREAAIRNVSALLRLAGREFRRAIDSTDAVSSGLPRNICGRRFRAWLRDQDLIRVNRLLDRIDRILVQANKRRKGRPFALTTVLVPLARKPRT